MNKKLVIGLVILSVLALGFSAYNFVRPTTTEVIKETIKEIGAMPGNELQGPEFTVNGITHRYIPQTARISTTTPCAIQGPSSTSTLVFASFSGTASSTGAVILSMAQAANAFATTTRIGDEFLTTSAAEHTIVASTTASNGAVIEGTHIFAPNAWLVFGIEGTTVGADNAPAATCKAKWIIN